MRIELERLIELGERRVEFARAVAQAAAGAPGARIARIEPDRQRVIGHRASVVSGKLPRLAAIVINLGVARIDFDGFIEVADRRAEIALFGAYETTIDQRVGV